MSGKYKDQKEEKKRETQRREMLLRKSHPLASLLQETGITEPQLSQPDFTSGSATGGTV